MGSRLALAATLVCLLAVGGCGSSAAPPSIAASSSVSKPTASSRSETTPATTYLDGLVAQTIAKLATPAMGEYERAKAAFDYMIENTILDEPIGLDLWRIYDGSDTPLSFVENRSLSVLQYGVGMCEDYAAAFTLLLRGLGLEAQYVPGLTYSLEGQLVDHAWVTARVDGVWYHLDCQLEDNISRHGAIRYRYFMKSDTAMAGSHLWGQNLISSALLTPEQNSELATSFLNPPCPQDYPTPARQSFDEAAAPDIPALTANAAEQIAAYEHKNGLLPPIELNIVPPVFGLGGYGPPDEG